MARPRGIPSSRKGISMIQEYGEDKAKEIKRKISQHPNVRKTLGTHRNISKESRLKNSISQKIKYQDPEYKKRILELSRKGGFGKRKNKYVPSETSKMKNRLAHLGKRATLESRQKQSLAIRNKILRGEFTPRFTLGIRKDLCFRVRSIYEANICRLFKYSALLFEYETKRFKLLNGQIYICDFYLPELNIYLEVKPGRQAKGLDKIKLFSKEYPDLNFKILDREGYFILDNKYSSIIPNWEKYESYKNRI